MLSKAGRQLLRYTPRLFRRTMSSQPFELESVVDAAESLPPRYFIRGNPTGNTPGEKSITLKNRLMAELPEAIAKSEKIQEQKIQNFFRKRYFKLEDEIQAAKKDFREELTSPDKH